MFSASFLSGPKWHSIRFSHDALVGVKYSRTLGPRGLAPAGQIGYANRYMLEETLRGRQEA